MSYTQPTAEEIAERRAQLAPFDGWNERAFCQLVAWNGIPKTYLDLGSGTGAMVNCARKLGSEAYGVDLINGPEGHFITHDLTRPLVLDRPKDDGPVTYSTNALGEVDHVKGGLRVMSFDLITCLEVAEHLPPDSHETLIETIWRHLRPMPNMTDSSGLLVFSAAPPGQQGEHHIGCRPAFEWRGMFHEAGITYRADYTRQLAHLIGWVAGPAAHWLAGNLMVFDRGPA